MPSSTAECHLLCDKGPLHGRQLLTPSTPSRHWSGLAGLCLRACDSSWGGCTPSPLLRGLPVPPGHPSLHGCRHHWASAPFLPEARNNLHRGLHTFRCVAHTLQKHPGQAGEEWKQSGVGWQQSAQDRLSAYPAGVSCKPVSVILAFQHQRDAACTAHSRNHPTQILQLPLEPLSSVLSSAGPVVCGSELQNVQCSRGIT